MRVKMLLGSSLRGVNLIVRGGRSVGRFGGLLGPALVGRRAPLCRAKENKPTNATERSTRLRIVRKSEGRCSSGRVDKKWRGLEGAARVVDGCGRWDELWRAATRRRGRVLVG